MLITLSSVKEYLNKVIEKTVFPNRSRKGPDKEIINSFDTNVWKASYIMIYYVYHGVSRIVSLWLVFTYVNSL